MKIKILGGILMIAVLAITSAAKADTVTYQQHHKKHMLEHRLRKDVRKGEITRVEAAHFRKEEKRIHEEKRMAMANRAYTPAERMHIHHQQRMLNRSLYHDEHKA